MNIKNMIDYEVGGDFKKNGLLNTDLKIIINSMLGSMIISKLVILNMVDVTGQIYWVVDAHKELEHLSHLENLGGMMKMNIIVQKIKNIQKDYSGKRVSTNEKLLVDYLNSDIYEGEDNHYLIRNNIVFGKHRGGNIFLFYKEGDNIYYRFAENNKKFTKKIILLIPDKYNFYLMDRQVMLPKIRKDILGNINVFDLIHSIIHIYVTEEYYTIISKSRFDFLDILFSIVRMFTAEDILFSKDMSDLIKRITKDKDDETYGWVYSEDIPKISLPQEYIVLRPVNLKREYKLSCLIS